MNWTDVEEALPPKLTDVVVAHLDDVGGYTWEIAFLDMKGAWRAVYHQEALIENVRYWHPLPTVDVLEHVA